MRKIGNFRFPDMADPQEMTEWKATFRGRPLAHKVLCIAKTRIEGTWNAYCKAVPGENYEKEWEDAWQYGDKLEEHVALAIFPEFAGIPYAR